MRYSEIDNAPFAFSIDFLFATNNSTIVGNKHLLCIISVHCWKVAVVIFFRQNIFAFEITEEANGKGLPVDLEWMVKKGKWLTLVVLEAVDTVLVMPDWWVSKHLEQTEHCLYGQDTSLQHKFYWLFLWRIALLQYSFRPFFLLTFRKCDTM